MILDYTGVVLTGMALRSQGCSIESPHWFAVARTLDCYQDVCMRMQTNNEQTAVWGRDSPGT